MHQKKCVAVCENINPRNKEIVNASPLFFNSAITPDRIYPKRLDIPELFPQKEVITTGPDQMESRNATKYSDIK